MTVRLKGMTWSHPRGFDPMVATSRAWKEQTGVEIDWDKRSLQDFESFPVEELARNYDLVVIDHPHVGQITKEGCLLPLDVAGREAERADLANGSVGRSYESYHWQGHQWAFPIDAATQVQAYRPDLIERGVGTWDDLIALARAGRALLPLRPPHSLMTVFSLAGNLGMPCSSDTTLPFMDRAAGVEIFGRLAELVALLPVQCLKMDPIAVFEEMAEEQSTIAATPYAYGYVNYASDGFRHNRLAFCDVPDLGANGPAGTALGGTGIAVSAFASHQKEAIAYAYWVASGEIQRTLFAEAGGQPGHAAAWEDDEVNATSHDFFRATRRTLEGAWVRPRHDGYMRFQQTASERINAALQSGGHAAALVDDLNRLYEESL